jgi:hypothetical protein
LKIERENMRSPFRKTSIRLEAKPNGPAPSVGL